MRGIGERHSIFGDVVESLKQNDTPTVVFSKETEEFFKGLIGKPIAVMCLRYCYRGILEKVSSDIVILSRAKRVEVLGNSDEPDAEAEVGEIMLLTFNIECFFFPKWVAFHLEKDLEPK